MLPKGNNRGRFKDVDNQKKQKIGLKNRQKKTEKWPKYDQKNHIFYENILYEA